MTFTVSSDARVVRRPQAEADQGERVGADDVDGGLGALSEGTILDGDEAVHGRIAVGLVQRREAHVVAVDSRLVAPESVPATYIQRSMAWFQASAVSRR